MPVSRRADRLPLLAWQTHLMFPAVSIPVPLTSHIHMSETQDSRLETRASIAMTRDQTRPLQSSLKKPIGHLRAAQCPTLNTGSFMPMQQTRLGLDNNSGMLGDVPSPHPHIHPAFARQIWRPPLLSASLRLAHWLVAPWLHPQHITVMRWDSTKGPLKSVEGRPELVGLITASVLNRMGPIRDRPYRIHPLHPAVSIFLSQSRCRSWSGLS